MANSSVLPPHSAKAAADRSPAARDLAAGTVPPATPALPPAGPRKLVRPTLPESTIRRTFSRRPEPALMAHQALAEHAIAAAGHESSHAEAFYFPKAGPGSDAHVFRPKWTARRSKA